MDRCIFMVLVIVAYQAFASEKQAPSSLKAVSPRSISMSFLKDGAASPSRPGSPPSSSMSVSRSLEVHQSELDLEGSRRSSTSFPGVDRRLSVVVGSQRVVSDAHTMGLVHLSPPVKKLSEVGLARRASELFHDNPIWRAYCEKNRLTNQARARLEISLIKLMENSAKNDTLEDFLSRLTAAQSAAYATVTRRSQGRSEPELVRKVDDTQRDDFTAVMTRLLVEQNNTVTRINDNLEDSSRKTERNFRISLCVGIPSFVAALIGIGGWAFNS